MRHYKLRGLQLILMDNIRNADSLSAQSLTCSPEFLTIPNPSGLPFSHHYELWTLFAYICSVDPISSAGSFQHYSNDIIQIFIQYWSIAVVENVANVTMIFHYETAPAASELPKHSKDPMSGDVSLGECLSYDDVACIHFNPGTKNRAHVTLLYAISKKHLLYSSKKRFPSEMIGWYVCSTWIFNVQPPAMSKYHSIKKHYSYHNPYLTCQLSFSQSKRKLRQHHHKRKTIFYL